MAKYSQLTQGEKYQIWVFRKAGKSNGEIARELGRHPSTIGREIRRKRGERGYRPKQAHQAARERRKQVARAVKFTTEVRLLVEERLEWEWSPEQIASRLKHEQGIEISHERIYQYVLEDKRNGGLLYRHLRRGRRRRKKRYGAPERRGRIPDRVGIAKRPKVANERRRRGDWEGDTMHGKGRSGLVTLVDRKSHYSLLGLVRRRTAVQVNAAIETMIAGLEAMFKTLTVDNGREFAAHRVLSETLEVKVYFADPYQSCQRGTNKNTDLCGKAVSATG